MDEEANKSKNHPSFLNDSHYRILFENANDAIFIMRRNKFIDCNKKALELFSCKMQQIVGKTPIDFSPHKQSNGDDSTSSASTKIDSALSGSPQKFEWIHKKADGTLFDAEVSLNRIKLSSEYYLQAIVRDVTQRKLSDKYLKERENIYKALFEHNYSVILLIDPQDGTIVDANPAACTYYGHSRNYLKRMKITEINTLSTDEVHKEMERAKSEKRNYFYN